MADYYDTYGTNNSYGANDTFGANDSYGANNAYGSNDAYSANDGYMSTDNSGAPSGYDAEDGLYSTNSVGQGGEDVLLDQIDAFRDKAQQLQSMINAKQSRVAQLEALVNEKEGTINNLQGTMVDRQELSRGINADMSRHFDDMTRSINASLDNIQRKLDEQASNASNGGEISEDSIKEITDTVNGLKSDMNSMKEELSEKVHSENVKVYRNINDLITEMKESDNSAENGKEVLKKVRGTKAVAGWALFFGILDFVGILGVAALMLKMIGLLPFF